MLRSLARAAGHRVRMAARPLANRMSSRISVRGRDNIVDTRGAVLRRARIKLRGAGHRVVIAPQARISNVEISMEGRAHRLVIGSHVRIHAGAFHFFDEGCFVEIGERTSIYGAEFGASEGCRITVGEGCLLSTGIEVRNGDSHSIIDSASGRRLNPAADVDIGPHVWVGARTLVLKGSRIEADAVIGAGSVVAGSIAAGSVAAGVPARTVASGVTWRPERTGPS